MEAASRVGLSDDFVDCQSRLLQRQMEDRRQRRSRIFDVGIERSRRDRSIAYERAAEVHAAIDFASRRLELLRNQFAEDHGLREVF